MLYLQKKCYCSGRIHHLQDHENARVRVNTTPNPDSKIPFFMDILLLFSRYKAEKRLKILEWKRFNLPQGRAKDLQKEEVRK